MAVAAINGNDVWIDPELRLVALRPADAATLCRALAAAGLSRSLLVLGAGDRCLAVAVHPPLRPNTLQARPRAVSLCRRSALFDSRALGAFGRAHGLTPAELTVLDAQCDGLRAKEVALRLHSSIATVRSHLRSIYHKTGSRDWHDLIAQLALLPALGPALA